MQGYLLFTAPALFLLTSDFYFMLLDYKINNKHRWFFNIILILLIALPIRYGLERIKPFENRDRNPQWVLDLKELNNENIKDGILLNYENPIEAMFYTNLITYSYIPTKKTIVSLINKGYTIIINDDEIPKEIESMDGIIIKRLTAAKRK